jgi:hypothetical protein
MAHLGEGDHTFDYSYDTGEIFYVSKAKSKSRSKATARRIRSGRPGLLKERHALQVTVIEPVRKHYKML